MVVCKVHTHVTNNSPIQISHINKLDIDTVQLVCTSQIQRRVP